MRGDMRQFGLLGGLAAVGLAGAASSLVVALAIDQAAGSDAAPGAEPFVVALRLVTAWSFVVAGMIAWVRRPENRTGALMILVGLTFLATGLTDGPHFIGTVAAWIQPIHLAIFIHTLLAFPSGRLGSWLDRWLTIGGYLFWFSFQLGSILSNHVAGAALAGTVSPLLAVGVTSIASVVLIRRWMLGSVAWRRSVSLLLWPGAMLLLTLGFFNLSQLAPLPIEREGAQWLFRMTFVFMPFAFLAVLLRGHLARGSVAGLVIDLEEARRPGAVRDALARTLGDPSLSLAYWLTSEERYVALDGSPLALPRDDEDRSVTVVERDGRQVAAIIHDSALDENPRLVRAAAAAAALALDNERLQAELRARLADLRLSRARIVEAADQERRRIERNLHDGTQQRLTSIAMALGVAESRLHSDPTAALENLRQARGGLHSALSELREISQGIHPGILTERGLQPAVEDLAYAAALPVRVRIRIGDRLPESVEATAYYVVAEALANVAKHARATAVVVEAQLEAGQLALRVSDDGVGGAEPRQGTGLRGLSDRLQAVGGSLNVESRPHRGTRLEALIPCG